MKLINSTNNMDNFAQFRESQYELRGLNTDNLELSVNPQITMETDTSLENILEGKAPFLPKQMPFTSSSTSPIKPVLANIFKVFQKENKSEEEISLSDLKHFQFESQFQHSKQAEEEKFKSSEISRNKDKKGESQRKEENYAKYMSKIEEVEKEEEINNSLLPSMYLEEESPRLPPLPANQNINISNPSRSSQINQFNKKSLMRIKELDQSPYQSLEVPGASGLGSICQTKDPYKVMASPLAILSKDKSLSQVNGLYSQIIFLKQQIQKDFTHCKSEHVLNEVKGSLYSEINKELDSHIDNFEKERNKMGDSLIKTYQELEKVSKEIEEIIENSAEMDLKHLQNLRSKVSDLNNKVKKQKITEFPAEVQITPKEEVNNMKLFNNSLKRELFKANNSIEKLHNQIEKQENQLDEYKLQESQLISKLQRVPDKENLPSFQSVPNAQHTGSPISKRNPLASSILKEVTNKPSHAAYSSIKTSQKTTPRYREPLQIHNLSEETIKSTQFNQINPLTHSKSISPNQQISQRNQINQINQINEINDRTELNEVSEFNERSKSGDFNQINEFSLINQNSQNTNQIRQGDIQIKAKLSYLLDHVKAFHKSLINNSRVSFCKSIIYKQSGFESHVHVPKSLDQIVDEIGQALDELYSKMESSCKSKEEAFNTMLIKIKNTHLKKLLTIKQEHSSKLEVIQTHIQTEGKNDRSLYQEQLHLNKENETCIFISQCENERLNSELLELKAEVDNLQQENTIIVNSSFLFHSSLISLLFIKYLFFFISDRL